MARAAASSARLGMVIAMPLPIRSGSFDPSRVGRWSPTAFMFGGGAIFAVLPLLFIIQAGAQGLFAAAVALFGIGVVSILVALLGLRPLLADGAPRLTAAGTGIIVILAGLALLALFVIATLTLLGPGLGMSVPDAPEFGLVTPPLFGAIVLGLVIFGIASWSTAVPSRTFGGLLVALAVLWVLAFVVGTRSVEFDNWDFLAFAVPSLGTVLAGYLLRTGRTQPDGGFE
jgi:hypothetical protein